MRSSSAIIHLVAEAVRRLRLQPGEQSLDAEVVLLVHHDADGLVRPDEHPFVSRVLGVLGTDQMAFHQQPAFQGGQVRHGDKLQIRQLRRRIGCRVPAKRSTLAACSSLATAGKGNPATLRARRTRLAMATSGSGPVPNIHLLGVFPKLARRDTVSPLLHIADKSWVRRIRPAAIRHPPSGGHRRRPGPQ